MKKSKWFDCQGNEFFPKTKGDSITGQDRAQKHCDFRFSQIEKKSKVAVLQLKILMTTDSYTMLSTVAPANGCIDKCIVYLQA